MKKRSKLSRNDDFVVSKPIYIFLTVCKKPLDQNTFYWGISAVNFNIYQSQKDGDLTIYPRHEIIEQEYNDQLNIELKIIQNAFPSLEIDKAETILNWPIALITSNKDEKGISLRSGINTTKFEDDVNSAFEQLEKVQGENAIYYENLDGFNQKSFMKAAVEIKLQFNELIKAKGMFPN